jgi:repressor of nif and glnA expression
MTSVTRVTVEGNGEILANYREIPAACGPLAEEVRAKLNNIGIGGILLMGSVSEPVCEIPIEPGRIGVILIGGLNPVAAAVEAGLAVESLAMSTVIDYRKMMSISKA